MRSPLPIRSLRLRLLPHKYNRSAALLRAPALTARRPLLTQQSSLLPHIRRFTMEAKELAQYLADAPPAVVRLEIEKHFVALSDKQKRYAHFISRYEETCYICPP